MTADEARALEETLGELIRRFRAEEITPLTRRIEALEHALATERRLAALEARLIEPERHLIRPEHASWRNGGG